MSLFDEPAVTTASRESIPLAERVRPRSLGEFVGHEPLLGEGRPIRMQIQSGRLASMIFWGPPGSGKTTLARLLAKETKSRFVALSAVDAGVKEVRKVIDDAKALTRHSGEKLILFIDEIHRFNKAQQDALLHSVEEGTLTLIGATTENPSFEVINALLSRCRVYRLDALSTENLNTILDQALMKDAFLKQKPISLDARVELIFFAGGDARNLLNTLELAVQLAVPDADGTIRLTKKIVEEATQRRNQLYDRAGEAHYDTISAFIKSLRGSDPDAALYWMARMLEGGEDPKFIARRMVILASEDIGNADPYALTLAVSTFTGIDVIGMPEGRILLAQCATYLASVPKSNAAYVAGERAIEDVRNHDLYPVPLHLRNAPTKLMENMEYGKGYRYAHDFADSQEKNFVEQEYLPPPLKDQIYYEPSENGREKTFKERLERLWRKRRK